MSVSERSAGIEIIVGDITGQSVDAIVNAANKTLLGGGGVDGAIHRAAGKQLLEECRRLNGCKTGEAKLTAGYKLRATFVIHTVGPIYGQECGREAELLASCYRNSLTLAANNQVKAIAFPSISTGAFGYPIREASMIAIKGVQQFLETTASTIERVVFVTFSDQDYRAYRDAHRQICLREYPLT